VEEKSIKTVKPTSLINSSNVIIGGKTYSSAEIKSIAKEKISQVQAFSNAENKMIKSTENQTSVINTMTVSNREKSINVSTNSIVNVFDKSSTNLSNSKSNKVQTQIQNEQNNSTNIIKIITGENLIQKNQINIHSNTSGNINQNNANIKTNDSNTQSNTNNINNNNNKNSSKTQPEKKQPNKVSATSQIAKDVVYIGSKAINYVQGAMLGSGDLSAQVAGGAIVAGKLGFYTFKVAQKTPKAIKTSFDVTKKVGVGIYKTGKNAIDVVTTTGRTTLTVANTLYIANQLKNQLNLPVSRKDFTNILKSQADITNLNKTATSKAIIKGVQSVQKKLQTVKKGLSQIKTGAIKTATVIRGMTNGTIQTAVVARSVLSIAKRATVKLLKTGGKAVVKGTLKGLKVATLKGIPKLAKVSGKVTMGVGNALSKSDDMALQGVGQALKVGTQGIKTGIHTTKFAYKTVKTSVKAGYRTGKAIYKTVSYIRNKGLKAAWQKAGQMTRNAFAKAGKSVVNMAINLVKQAASKVILPILIIVVVVAVASGAVAAPLGAVGGVFGSVISIFTGNGDSEDFDVKEYLMGKVPALRNLYIQDLSAYLNNQFKANGGTYDFVRLFTNQSSNEVDRDIDSINAVFYTEEKIVDIMEPIFNAIIMQKYESSPSDIEAQTTLGEIFGNMFSRNEEAVTEWCGEDADGTTYPHSCGHIHALSNCPNKVSGVHTSYTCSLCDSRETHISTTIDEEGNTRESSTSTFHCSGYSYCGGHSVLKLTLSMDGTYKLLKKYFTDPIDKLANKTNRTDDEEEELDNLKSYYEICQQMMRLNGGAVGGFNGSMTVADLGNINWVEGTRLGNSEIIDLGLTQVGQVGGQPYWSWYGFDSRVEWCACFVNWCFYMNGDDELYGHSDNNAYCPSMVNYFKSRGIWENGGYTDLTSGDVILFDWEQDGIADHIGIVIGRDENNVYTVEGNSGDEARVYSYNLNSNVILGYGLIYN